MTRAHERERGLIRRRQPGRHCRQTVDARRDPLHGTGGRLFVFDCPSKRLARGLLGRLSQQFYAAGFGHDCRRGGSGHAARGLGDCHHHAATSATQPSGCGDLKLLHDLRSPRTATAACLETLALRWGLDAAVRTTASWWNRSAHYAKRGTFGAVDGRNRRRTTPPNCWTTSRCALQRVQHNKT